MVWHTLLIAIYLFGCNYLFVGFFGFCRVLVVFIGSKSSLINQIDSQGGREVTVIICDEKQFPAIFVEIDDLDENDELR